jgi:signal transduction histidine kinase
MKIIRKIYGYIQPHFVTVFSVLLFAAFAMVALVFNVAMDRYIYNAAEVEIYDIAAFRAVINRLLLVTLAVVWLVSMVLAAVLANSMMKPLRILRDFVRQIGRGDFSPNSHTFANEEFDELNQSLNSAVKQLAAYDNEQKTFFQNVSHELRTPLMSIQSYAEGINQGIMDADAASATILEATGRLKSMVEDILYVSRLDSVSTPAMEQVNLCAIVETRISLQQPVAKIRCLNIKYISDGEPIFIHCAVEYIDRAVDNLISNAIRYAKKEITVECFAIGAKATVRVTDDGPGFEVSALSHVFERFYRGKNVLTGIGLATVKSITDQHKGSATAENGKEKGAILTISLPRKRER